MSLESKEQYINPMFEALEAGTCSGPEEMII
jgi:hypothetical protein